MSSDGVKLVSLRSYFYLGLHEKVLAEAKELGTLSGATEAARQSFVYRSKLALGDYKAIQSEVNSNSPTALQVIKLNASYRSAGEAERKAALETLGQWSKDEALASDRPFSIAAAELYLAAGDVKEALRSLHQGESLDEIGLAIQILLSMDRIDLAKAELKKMNSIEEDDTLTQLATAWIFVAEGGTKIGEAQEIYQDLQERYGASVVVLNSLAVCQIAQQNYSGAIQSLNAARGLSAKKKTPISPDTYINTIVCLQYLRESPERIQNITKEFCSKYPKNPWVLRQAEALAEIKKSSKAYA